MDSENDVTDAEYHVPMKRRKRQKSQTLSIWDHFIDLGGGEARCKICDKVFSFRTSITNLKKHLCGKHPEVVPPDSELATKHYLFSNAKPSKYVVPSHLRRRRKKRRYLTYPDDNETSLNNTHESEDNAVKFSSEISLYFEEADDDVRCKQCKEVVLSDLDHMKAHLEEQHTSIFEDIIAKVHNNQDANSEGDNVIEDDNTYTEILYLEDESGNKLDYTPKKHKYSRKHDTTITHLVKREREVSPLNVQVTKSKEAEDESEVFLKYVGFLLKKIPKEATQKLHLDIINMIMNTRMQNQHKSVSGQDSHTDNSTLEREMFLMHNGTSNTSSK